MPTTARGRIIDSAGAPVTDRTIVLQALGADGWTTLRRIEDGEIDIRLPASGPGGKEPVPLRLLDQSTRTPLIVSSAPEWSADDQTLVADFGQVQLLDEPVRRLRAGGQDEQVIGIPLDGPGRGPVRGGVDLPDSAQGLRFELAEKQRLLSETRLELSTSKESLGQVRHELSDALARVDTLTTRLGTPTKVVDVIAGLGSQLSVTNTKLAEQTTPFRLAEVSLDLRGRLGADGETIVMDGSGDGSGLRADLVVDAASPTVPMQTVPSVLGLTASAAARVLRSVGFPMDGAGQQLPPDQGVPGQAVTQQPAGGGEAEFGTSVLVVFGVRNESDE